MNNTPLTILTEWAKEEFFIAGDTAVIALDDFLLKVKELLYREKKEIVDAFDEGSNPCVAFIGGGKTYYYEMFEREE